MPIGTNTSLDKVRFAAYGAFAVGFSFLMATGCSVHSTGSATVGQDVTADFVAQTKNKTYGSSHSFEFADDQTVKWHAGLYKTYAKGDHLPDGLIATEDMAVDCNVLVKAFVESVKLNSTQPGPTQSKYELVLKILSAEIDAANPVNTRSASEEQKKLMTNYCGVLLPEQYAPGFRYYKGLESYDADSLRWSGAKDRNLPLVLNKTDVAEGHQADVKVEFLKAANGTWMQAGQPLESITFDETAKTVVFSSSKLVANCLTQTRGEVVAIALNSKKRVVLMQKLTQFTSASSKPGVGSAECLKAESIKTLTLRLSDSNTLLVSVEGLDGEVEYTRSAR